MQNSNTSSSKNSNALQSNSPAINSVTYCSKIKPGRQTKKTQSVNIRGKTITMNKKGDPVITNNDQQIQELTTAIESIQKQLENQHEINNYVKCKGHDFTVAVQDMKTEIAELSMQALEMSQSKNEFNSNMHNSQMEAFVKPIQSEFASKSVVFEQVVSSLRDEIDELKSSQSQIIQLLYTLNATLLNFRLPIGFNKPIEVVSSNRVIEKENFEIT